MRVLGVGMAIGAYSGMMGSSAAVCLTQEVPALRSGLVELTVVPYLQLPREDASSTSVAPARLLSNFTFIPP